MVHLVIFKVILVLIEDILEVMPKLFEVVLEIAILEVVIKVDQGRHPDWEVRTEGRTRKYKSKYFRWM